MKEFKVNNTLIVIIFNFGSIFAFFGRLLGFGVN